MIRATAIVGFALITPASAIAQSYDSYGDGHRAGYDSAARSNEMLSLPIDKMPESGSSASQGSAWRDGYRSGYQSGETENRDRACFYGVSPFPCR